MTHQSIWLRYPPLNERRLQDTAVEEEEYFDHLISENQSLFIYHLSNLFQKKNANVVMKTNLIFFSINILYIF